MERIVIEDSESDDDVMHGVTASKPVQRTSSITSSRRSSQSQSQSYKGVCFEEEDDEDEFDPFKSSSRQGKR